MSRVSTLALAALGELARMLELKKHEAGVIIVEESIRRIELLESMRDALKRDLNEAEEENERLEKLLKKATAPGTYVPWLNEKQTEEFRQAALPLMEWLNKNGHPHITVIVDSERVELVEGLATARREPLK